MSKPAQRLLKLALTYPGATEEFPWGERVVIPLDVFAEWLDESYRAVAKKRRIAELETRS
jgi:hypothetical protein